MTHDERIRALLADPPRGVPTRATLTSAGPGRWPATFGDVLADGTIRHRLDEGQGYCFQCLHCAFYAEIDADWGWCLRRAGQYEGTPVFEHWSCAAYAPQPIHRPPRSADRLLKRKAERGVEERT